MILGHKWKYTHVDYYLDMSYGASIPSYTSRKRCESCGKIKIDHVWGGFSPTLKELNGGEDQWK